MIRSGRIFFNYTGRIFIHEREMCIEHFTVICNNNTQQYLFDLFLADPEVFGPTQAWAVLVHSVPALRLLRGLWSVQKHQGKKSDHVQ